MGTWQLGMCIPLARMQSHSLPRCSSCRFCASSASDACVAHHFHEYVYISKVPVHHSRFALLVTQVCGCARCCAQIGQFLSGTAALGNPCHAAAGPWRAQSSCALGCTACHCPTALNAILGCHMAHRLAPAASHNTWCGCTLLSVLQCRSSSQPYSPLAPCLRCCRAQAA